ncbi:PREDICTED: N-acetylglucosamine-6-phosphate deacetylase [Nicrophorus vespilloides]|uniref:N-acetylglucosamine-6-phosphate deacetylase n=1 Tax=Nicrophorus vespilloides TaxID=110193 RepID=A0ABM1NH68_NICVS|nr:PREDICTED: N-acetylglucosamine-6-phosphate deacetylase [Nicrophorus vespilloides]
MLRQFRNCRILRNHEIVRDDIWVRDGKVVDPEKIFFDEKIQADVQIDCQDAIVAPGFIELQINGAFGIDFSYNSEDIENGVNTIAKGLLQHGVTAFCPTLVTSPKSTYAKVMPKIKRRKGDENGATILGLHIEGPFINTQKKGAHPPEFIRSFDEGFKSLLDVYGDLSDVSIITLAPELENSLDVIKKLKSENIVVSVGHSMGNLKDGEAAVRSGASFITHLFNAMLPFHHRDPGLVGLLASDNIPEGRTVYFGIIADGIHTHPAALRIAYRAHPAGLVLVTDAISAMGLEEGQHNIGQFAVEIRDRKAFVAGTETLCGSIATMNECVQILHKATGCPKEFALEAASLHPASVLGITDKKGTLNFGADADFVFLNDDLDLISTWIAGKCVYSRV